MAIAIKPINPKMISIWIKGISPLIQHAWSDKGMKMMRMTAAERKKQPKVARNPEKEAMDATHFTPDGEYAIPLLALKASIISAAHKDLGIEKTIVKKSLFIPNIYPGMLAPMECSAPILREDIVRIGMNQTDLRYRPEFAEWRAPVTFQVDIETLTVEELVNLINRAGFTVGIGEWRPEKGGEYGRFQVDSSKEIVFEE